MNNKTTVFNEKQLTENILQGQKIPSFEPLNLHKMIHPKLMAWSLYVAKLHRLCLFHLITIGYSYRKILIDLEIAEGAVFSFPTKQKLVTTISETTII